MIGTNKSSKLKFFIYNPRRESYWIDNIELVVSSSLVDLGYKIVDNCEAANVVIAVQHFGDLRRLSGKKYVLYQIEQYDNKKHIVDKAYSFNPDITWGFDINRANEIYTPLGYHKCLEQPGVSVEKQDVDISFFGSMTKRRKKFLAKVKHPFKVVNQWSSETKNVTEFSRIQVKKSRLSAIKRSKINLNLNLSDRVNNTFTQWDRISHFLANGCFFITESIYNPFESFVPVFNSCSEYDELVEEYLNNPSARLKIADNLKYEYMNKFRMTDILKKRLELL